MGNLELLAQPWWVNLLLLVPLVAYSLFRRWTPRLTGPKLFAAALFAVSFAYVEATVAIYLGNAAGLLPGTAGTLPDVARLFETLNLQAAHLGTLPRNWQRIEECREAATMLILFSVAILAEQKRGERFAVFLWTFALWDIGYYIALWATIRWPPSLTSADVLFVLPVPWTSQVWFPILVSILTVAVVLITRRRGHIT